MSGLDIARGKPHLKLPGFMRRGTKVYDLAAGLPLVVLYGLGAVGHVESLKGRFANLNIDHVAFASVVSILAEVGTLLFALLFIAFVLTRPPAIARVAGLMPRIAAVAGTYLAVALVLLPMGQGPVWATSISTLLLLGGATFSVYAVSYLGRSVSLVAEARTLVTGGPYRLIRHPLYLGEEVAIAGAVLQCFSLFALALLVVQIGFQIYRMSCEESVLEAAFPEYAEYKTKTWRVLPGFY